MKKGKRITVIILVIVFAYIYAHVAKTHMIYSKQIDSSNYIVLDASASSVEQEFVCNEDTLDAVQVKCQISESMAEDNVCMSLQECATGKIVARTELNVNEIKSGKFNTFPFETLEECKGKRYKISFSHQPIMLFYHSETEGDMKLSVDGDEKEGVLIMKTVAERFDVETFCVLILLILYIIVFFRFLDRVFSR